MRLGKINRVEIRVSPYLMLFGVLWLIAGLPLETILLFVLVVLHETAHLAVAYLVGLRISGIHLYPFGGLAQLQDPVEWNPRQEIIVAAAGPVFNAVLALLFVLKVQNKLPLSFQTAGLFFLQANLALCIFNLLPGLPLDGGRILRAALSYRTHHRRATEIAARAGKVLGAFLFILGLVLFSHHYLYLSVALLGLFLYNAAQHEREKALYIFLRYLSRKEGELRRKGILAGRELVAFENTELANIIYFFRPRYYHYVRILDSSCKVKGRVSETQILRSAWEKGLHLPIKAILDQAK